MNVPMRVKKREAMYRMESLKADEVQVNKFKSGTIMRTGLFDIGGVYAVPMEELTAEEYAEINAFEKKYNALVYAVIRAPMEFGVCDSFLFVSDYAEEWEMEHEWLGDGIVMTYTINRTNQMLSEMGSIACGNVCGRLVRIH